MAILWWLSYWPPIQCFWLVLQIRCFLFINFGFRHWFSIFMILKIFKLIVRKYFQKFLFSEKWAINRKVRTNTHLKNHWMETKDKGSTAGNWIRQSIATARSDGSQRERQMNDKWWVLSIWDWSHKQKTWQLSGSGVGQHSRHCWEPVSGVSSPVRWLVCHIGASDVIVCRLLTPRSHRYSLLLNGGLLSL